MAIDRFSDQPPYRQVAAVLRDRIRGGQITARLPSARDLVAEFGVAPMTALKALRLLRDEGWAKMAVGMGTWVTDREDWPEAD
jgi:DNA-binding GntR family transcriptional regulator